MRPPGRRRRNAHHAEERLEGQVEPPWHAADHSRPVERDVQDAGLVEIVGQGAGQRPDHVPAPILPELHVEDLDREHVAGLGPLDRDRAGEDMAGQHAFVLGMNLEHLGRNVKLAGVGQHVRTAADGVDRHLVTACDDQGGLERSFEEAPMTGLGAGMQVMMGHVARPSAFVGPGLDRAIDPLPRRFLKMDGPVKPAHDAITPARLPCISFFPRPSAPRCCPSISWSSSESCRCC